MRDGDEDFEGPTTVTVAIGVVSAGGRWARGWLEKDMAAADGATARTARTARTVIARPRRTC